MVTPLTQQFHLQYVNQHESVNYYQFLVYNINRAEHA